MRIFHVITRSSLGGAQSVVVNLANSQVKNNEVFVLSSAGGEAWKALNEQVHVITIPELKREISPADVIVLLKLFFYRFKYNPDVVHLHSSKIGVLGRIAFSPFKTVYTVHGFDSIRLANRKFLFLEKILKFWCRFIVGVSQYDLKHLHEEKIKQKVSYIYNGVFDYSKAMSKHEDLVALIRQKRNKYRNVVMCIARDNAPKSPELFIEIAKKNSDCFFVWIGNKEHRKNSDNLLWAGEIPEAYLLLKETDLFVLPTHYEGLPMCILEAFSFSKPVVASDVGGISEIVNGENGKVVNNTVEEFTQAIQFFLEDKARYSQACISARKTYEADFQDSVMADRYMKLYQKICRGK